MMLWALFTILFLIRPIKKVYTSYCIELWHFFVKNSGRPLA
ncbi:hypothetical protein BGAFAR04_K0040 (plasmid) [Borreliella garinii Far04]|nr:hypothetical protein BGAFAR04_K0040 [Borreliella garinii Far04]